VIPGSGKGLRFSLPSDGALISSFGMRAHPATGAVRMHAGVDFGLEIGAAVRAGAAGRVIFAREQNRYGKIVIIAHGDGVETSYAHLSRIDVRDGDCVDRGAAIGASGATEPDERPLLHFEVRVNGRFFDPAWRLQGVR
jgi:murein DD-endopeptidase MepM/ murein hydrolase activator NlpD